MCTDLTLTLPNALLAFARNIYASILVRRRSGVHVAVSHVAVSHIAVSHIAVFHVAVLHVAVSHVAVSHIAV